MSQDLANERQTGQAQRLPALDVLRGIALFGILVVNFQFFAYPEGGFATPDGKGPAGSLDQIIRFVVQFLFDGKFILIFAFLFGWGLQSQIDRGAAFLPRYYRRMAGLFLIGLMHAVFLFAGDILVTYAILGLLLLTMRNWPARRLLLAALLFWALSIAGHACVGILVDASPKLSGSEYDALVVLHQSGSFAEIMRHRIVDLIGLYAVTPLLFAPQVMGMFLTGLACAKHFPQAGFDGARPAARRLLGWFIIPALAANAAYAGMAVWGDATETLTMVMRGVAAPMLTLVYLASALLLLTNDRIAGPSRIFTGDGRLSLSIYIGESVLMNVLFFGFGLYDKVSYALGMLICIGVYALLSLAGSIWLRWFRLGPMEWMLRSITEAKFLPMLVEAKTKGMAPTRQPSTPRSNPR